MSSRASAGAQCARPRSNGVVVRTCRPRGTGTSTRLREGRRRSGTGTDSCRTPTRGWRPASGTGSRHRGRRARVRGRVGRIAAVSGRGESCRLVPQYRSVPDLVDRDMGHWSCSLPGRRLDAARGNSPSPRADRPAGGGAIGLPAQPASGRPHRCGCLVTDGVRPSDIRHWAVRAQARDPQHESRAASETETCGAQPDASDERATA